MENKYDILEHYNLKDKKMENKYDILDYYNFKDKKIRILPNQQDKSKNDWLNEHINTHKYHIPTDEEKLEKIDIKVIETFLRKKKLEKLKK